MVTARGVAHGWREVQTMRLIDADRLNARLSRNGTPYYTVPDIENAPTVDAAPIRHGRWVQKKEWHLGRWVAWFECSECGEHDDNSDMYEMMPFCNLSNYCPGCGAKMDGGSQCE